MSTSTGSTLADPLSLDSLVGWREPLPEVPEGGFPSGEGSFGDPIELGGVTGTVEMNTETVDETRPELPSSEPVDTGGGLPPLPPLTSGGGEGGDGDPPWLWLLVGVVVLALVSDGGGSS